DASRDFTRSGRGPASARRSKRRWDRDLRGRAASRPPGTLVASCLAGGTDTVRSKQLPVIYLARHGETEWTVSGRHTGRTDLPLTAHGEVEAQRLGEQLQGLAFASVLTSPLHRAVQTCAAAGFGAVAEVEPDLFEWDYGDYEGRTSADIHAE